MKSNTFASAMKGLAALMVSLLALVIVGTSVAETYRSAIDSQLGTTSYITNTDEDAARFKSDYATIEEMVAAAKDIAVREGEEGTVVMKNDNDVLPLPANSEVVLLGLAAYEPFPYATGDLRAGNDDAVDLVQALTDEGFTVNSTVADFYTEKILNKRIEEGTNAWTGEVEYTEAFDTIYASSPGDYADEFQIVEVPPSEFSNLGAPSNLESSISSDSTAILVFARGAGEGNTYKPGSAVNYAGEATGEDPLALSEDELALVDFAKEKCAKVLVLINSGNTMVLKDIAAGGSHEVDGIAYIGCINDYQLTGVAHVLSGAVNATGALPDTYVADNASIPAVTNFGGDYYADYESIGRSDDSRYPGVEIANTTAGSFGGTATYNGGFYIVEAEGIYVGYKYFETRYYDSVMNPSSNASSSAGATQGSSWNYGDEVLYTFGHGLSYLDYTQTLKSVDVDLTAEGNVTAVIEIKNNSDKDGKFLAQLYVQQPYTDYDRENNVEKSAVMFLNAGKVDVAAGATEEITIVVPSKYLASYDYTNAKTYILDAGDYLFTAAAGSHEATNNFLAAQGKSTADGMDAEGKGAVVTWTLNELDNTTFAVENGKAVTNVADKADLNYWTGTDTVTYLSRADWDATYPINYNEVEIKVNDSPKADEWIAELRGETYQIATDNPATEGVDKGLRFDTTNIQYDQLSDINNDFWNELVSQITIDEAVGAVIHGGSQSDVLTNVDNPIVNQNEGVSGFTAAYTDEATGKTYKFNVHSQTLLGSSFNPELAYEWGLVEGNTGLWLNRYDVWGTGLTQRRTPYNGRNYEYISEDPMLTNRIGEAVMHGCVDKGIINGPKHLGFNDQEHNRAGVSAYMNEQKFRETDLRGFQGALEDAGGLGVMIAFNRIGATNAAHFGGMILDVLRGEWGFNGLISTDMMNNCYYFNAESMVMAGITQVADFGGNDNHLNLGDDGNDATWTYLSVDAVSGDSDLVEQARQNLKYQLFTFANSAVMNVSTEKVATWWDTALSTAKIVLGVLAGICTLLFVVSTLKNRTDDEGAVSKGLTVGSFISILACILALASLVAYYMNIGAEGYFKGAEVTNYVLYAGLAMAALIVAIILKAIPTSGAARTITDIVAGLCQIAAPALLAMNLIDLIASRASGLGYIYFSNADVALEVQTAENLASANGSFIAMGLTGAAIVVSIIAAFTWMRKKAK